MIPERMTTQRQADLDRAWASLEEELIHLQRIVFRGVGSDADREIQRRAVLLVIAELYHRMSQREE